MSLIVQKYGGTSVGTPERILNVAKRILQTQTEGNQVVAVVSAMSGATDSLINLGAKSRRTQPNEKWMFYSQRVNKQR
jgi:aspartate kinase